MAEDERRNKIEAENHFYLELRHKHSGNFESMLLPEELTIWNIFPDNHKQLFTRSRDWEITVKNSLELFENRRDYYHKPAHAKLQTYLQMRKSCKTVMIPYEIKGLLFPLVYMFADDFSDYFTQELMDAIRQHLKYPDKIKAFDELDELEQEDYPIHIEFLEEQSHSDYLLECAAVWRSYLQPTLKMKSDKKPETQEQIDRWNRKVEEYYQPMGKFKFHAEICRKISMEEDSNHEPKHIANETRTTYRRLKNK